MVGGTWTEADKPKPDKTEWLSNKQWCCICEIS